MKLIRETKSFIKNVLANLEKKDWYHIIQLSAVVLFFISLFSLGQMIGNESNTSAQTANVVFSSVFDDDKYESKDYYSYSPNVFWDEVTNQVIFLNSEKKIVGRIDPQLLNLDEILEVTEDIKMPGFANRTDIGSVVLENPKNVFYFSAINSYGCGASNCHWALYRFDAGKDDLKVVDVEFFGQIMGLHLSPDLFHLAVVFGSTGGVCDNSYYAAIFETGTFTRQEIDKFDEGKYRSRILENFTWKNNAEATFTLHYGGCAVDSYEEVYWLYNIEDQKMTNLGSKIIPFNP